MEKTTVKADAQHNDFLLADFLPLTSLTAFGEHTRPIFDKILSSFSWLTSSKDVYTQPKQRAFVKEIYSRKLLPVFTKNVDKIVNPHY